MHVPFTNFRKESAVPGYSRRYLCHHLEFWWREHLSEWNLCQIHTFFSPWTFPWRFLKVFDKWKAPYVSGVWITPPIPLWLPVNWAVRFPPFSAKRKRPRTWTNIEKHDPRVMTSLLNVISANKYFVSTWLQALHPFPATPPERPGELARRLYLVRGPWEFFHTLGFTL